VAPESAELGGLHLPTAGYDSVEAIRENQGDLAIAGTTVLSIFIRKNRSDPRLADLRSLDPDVVETETLYAGTLAAFQFDGPNGALWKGWSVSLRNRLIPSQRTLEGECERGSWDGRSFRARLQATALNGMDFEFYYR
jgi:hypothetical protein